MNRRRFLAFTAGAGALAAQQAERKRAPSPGTQWDPRMGVADADKLFKYSDRRPMASLIKGDNRRKNVFNALAGVDDQVRPGLNRKKYVLIKVNGLAPGRNIGSTNLDCVHGILDYLAPRFKGPVVITEGGEATYKEAFEEFGWNTVAPEHKPMDISFALLNANQRYELMTGIDYDLHLVPIRLYARLLDPDAFLISSSVMKTHNMVVATLTIKNVVVGAAVSPPPELKRPWTDSDKRKFHVGIRQSNYNLYLGAKRLMANWGVGIIDGYEGMEGNGPSSGTPVAHRIAVASTDFVAADRVGLECMGIDAGWPGYLNYCYQDGLGQWDLSKIEVVGAKIADVQRKYRLHADVDRMLEWRGPMLDLPPNLGRDRRRREEELSPYA
ncbi:MAG: DUF362 domain-containing protein [Bryobacteraceae bacterium]